MWIVIALFFALLLTAIVFLLYKTALLRMNADTTLHTDFGDKDSWVLAHVQLLRKRGHVYVRERSREMTIMMMKKWVALVHRVNKWLHRKYPEFSYLIGDRSHIKRAHEVEASRFMEEMKAHKRDSGTSEINDIIDDSPR